MLDIHKIMSDLSKHRPIFHSEADFQFALAWQIHKAIPNCEIRLEMPYRTSQGNWYLDIWLQTMEIAIELKYRTKRMAAEKDGEYFFLKDHSGYSQGWYGFLKDIQRLEWVVADRKAKSGFAVLLTNDLNFWQSIHEGQRVGESGWPEEASSRTTEGIEESIRLKGSYPLKWQYYSHWKNKEELFSVPRFHYLAVSVK